jgi:antitoxin VapB
MLHNVYSYIDKYIVCYTNRVPLSIRNDSAERLARQVAKQTGESITEAIRKALEERLQRLEAKRQSGFLTGQIEDLLRRVDVLPNLDSRPDDEILGYDENGMPR